MPSMNLMLEIAEKVNQQLAIQEGLQKLPGTGYTSIFRINGVPILPPLMTVEKRLEMQNLRNLALNVEKKLSAESKFQPKSYIEQIAASSKIQQQESLSDVSADDTLNKFMDASTNTEKTWCRQKRVQSETLIYDNKCNAIFKYKTKLNGTDHSPRTKPERAQNDVVPTNTVAVEKTNLEEVYSLVKKLSQQNQIGSQKVHEPIQKSKSQMPQEFTNQTAAASSGTPAKLQSKLREVVRKQMLSNKSSSNPNNNKPRLSTVHEVTMELNRLKVLSDSEPDELDPAEKESLLCLISATENLKRELSGQKPIQRASTSPTIKTADSVASKTWINGSPSTNDNRLHSTLTKRCFSCPLEKETKYRRSAVWPTSPNTSIAKMSQVSEIEELEYINPVAAEPVGPLPSNIEVKQRMAEQIPKKTKSKSTLSKTFVPKNSSAGTSKSSKAPIPSQRQSVTTAHAASHANTNTTKRKQSTDPRNSLKRSITQKKINTHIKVNTRTPKTKAAAGTKKSPSATSSTKIPKSVPSGTSQSATSSSYDLLSPYPTESVASMLSFSNVEQHRLEMISNMEQQQRERFQQLVSQQTQQLQSIQANFEGQQQQLIDQMRLDGISFRGSSSSSSIEATKKVFVQQEIGESDIESKSSLENVGDGTK